MRKSRFTDEQIIGFLKQVESGVAVKDLGRKHGFSDAAFYKWRGKFGGMDVSEARRLRELEGENGKLKRLHNLRFPHSLGSFYEMVTSSLGFHPDRHAGKIVGLAAYGAGRVWSPP